MEKSKDYIAFMCDENNVMNCEKCPENRGETHTTEAILPCGQYNCWVLMHIERGRE